AGLITIGYRLQNLRNIGGERIIFSSWYAFHSETGKVQQQELKLRGIYQSIYSPWMNHAVRLW
ncbi:hypothetical protein MMO69_28380, partial [Escherichia coli]|nr:hypothetical protein [Escherichia coli]